VSGRSSRRVVARRDAGEEPDVDVDAEEAEMDTGTWILATVIVILLALWIVSTTRGSSRRRRVAQSDGRPSEQAREDHRTFRHDELSGPDGF